MAVRDESHEEARDKERLSKDLREGHNKRLARIDTLYQAQNILTPTLWGASTGDLRATIRRLQSYKLDRQLTLDGYSNEEVP